MGPAVKEEEGVKGDRGRSPAPHLWGRHRAEMAAPGNGCLRPGSGAGGGCAEGERGAGGAGGRGLAVRSPQGAGVDEGVLRPVGRPLRVSLVPL